MSLMWFFLKIESVNTPILSERAVGHLKWAIQNYGLGVNPDKTELVLFNRKMEIRTLGFIML